MASLYFSTG